MAMQKRPENLPDTPRPGVVETQEGAVLHPYDLLPPIVQLVQAQSAEGTAGKFRRRDTGEEESELLIVPLRVQAVRTKFAPGQFERDRSPECWSTDGLRGGPGARFPGRLCTECEFFTAEPWNATPAEGTCMPGYVVLLADARDFGTMMMRLNGVNAKIARVLAAPAHLRSVILKFTPQQVKGDRGNYFIISVSAQRKLTGEERGHVQELYRTGRLSAAPEGVEEEGPEEAPQQAPSQAPAAPPAPSKDNDLGF